MKKGEAPWGWGDESRETFSTTRWRGSLSSSFDFAPTFVSRETDHPSPPPPPPRNKLAIGRLPPLSSPRVSSNAASSIVRLIVENRRSTSRLFETDSHVESVLRSDPIGRYTEYSNDNDFFFFLTVAWMDPAGWIERRIETKADTTGSRNIRKRRPNATPIINNGRSTIATSNARRPCRASLRGNGASGSSVKHCR